MTRLVSTELQRRRRPSLRDSGLDVRAQADGRVQGLRAFVKEIQRPDIERSTREIDAGGRRGDDVHGRIIPMRREVRETWSTGASAASGANGVAIYNVRQCRPAVRRRIGQLLIGSFTGPSIPVEMRSLAREFDLGGVIFSVAMTTSRRRIQVADLAFDARRLGGEQPAWVSVDQEGGRVARLRNPFTEWPPMATLGRSDDASLAARFAPPSPSSWPWSGSRSTMHPCWMSGRTRATRSLAIGRSAISPIWWHASVASS